MDATGWVERPSREDYSCLQGSSLPWARDWLIGVTWSSATLLLSFAGLVALRRFWGGFRSTPDLLTLVAVGFLLALLASVSHYGAQTLCGRTSSTYRAVQGLIPLALAISVFSICLSGSSPWGVLLVVALLTCEEFIWLVQSSLLENDTDTQPVSQPVPVPFLDSQQGERLVREDFWGDFPTGVMRRIERIRGPAGEDICKGQIRSEFLSEQRTASVHLAFCPPFPITPILHFEQIEGPEASVKATQILPYGARLEVRLARTEPVPFETLIEFSAIVKADKGE